MEAGQLGAGGLGDVGRPAAAIGTSGTNAGRKIAAAGCVVLVAFGAAFGVSAATRSTHVVRQGIAPSAGVVTPVSVQYAASRAVKLPALAAAPKVKPKAKPKPPAARAVVAAAPVVAVRPVVRAQTPVRVTPVAPVTPVTVTPVSTPTHTGTGSGSKSTGNSSGSSSGSGSTGSGTVSGHG